MNLPKLHWIRIPNGDPYPVLICLPNDTPIMAIADLAPDYEVEEVAELICRRVNLTLDVRLNGHAVEMSDLDGLDVRVTVSPPADPTVDGQAAE